MNNDHRRKQQNTKQPQSTTRGSITVFFVVIFLSIILLTGSMVDVSRILVADNKMDSAMRAATKSLMSEYNPELLGAYGIFATDVEASRETFETYLIQNLEMSNTGFLTYEYQPGSAMAKGSLDTTIVNNQILMKQIEDYMHGKVALNTGEQVVNRVLGGVQAMLKSGVKNVIKSGAKEEDVLDDEGKVLKPNSSDIKDSTPDELQDALDSLEEEAGEGSGWRQEAVKEFAASAIEADMDSLDSASVLGDRTDRYEQFEEKISDMRSLSQTILRLQEELEEEQRKEESDPDRIDELERQIQENKLQYDARREEIRAMKEQEKQANTVIPTFGNYEDIIRRMEEATNLKGSFPKLTEAINQQNPVMSSNVGALLRAIVEQIEWIGTLDLESIAEKGILMAYVMDRCTYATSPTERELSYFQLGEVEYMIYGTTNEVLNLTLAAFNIFLFCYVINVIDLLLVCPMALVPALLLAIPFAADSLGAVLNGEKFLPLSKFFGKADRTGKVKGILKEIIGLQYSDFLYMRMLMLDKDTLLNRIRNLMIANANQSYQESGEPEIKASNLYTEIETRADVKINLLFLPMLPLDELNIKGFSGDGYIFSKQYGYSYQVLSE